MPSCIGRKAPATEVAARLRCYTAAMRIACALATLTLSAIGVAQVTIAELPQLARDRAARQRPAQEEKLKPYWGDFALDYVGNGAFLDKRIADAAQLGDSVVPLLLEKLTPADGSVGAQALANNCRRVLERLDPLAFLDALVELAGSSNSVAREQGLRLLGHAQSPRAVQILSEAVSNLKGDDQLLALEGLKRLKAVDAAPRVAELLGSSDRRMRERALDCLRTCKATAVVDTVLAALSVEKETRLLPSYVEYFAVAAKENDSVAVALLPLLERERLDVVDCVRLVEAMASIAPREHAPTLKRLRDFIDSGETGALALQAGLTMQALGDKSGLTRLRKSLDETLHSPKHNKDASTFELRANLFFAIENYKEAVDDYERVVEYTLSTSLQRKARKMLVRCEAHRRRWSQVVKHAKDGDLTATEMQELAAQDAAVQEALQKDNVRAWLQSLPTPKAPDKSK
jgi:tetratricopeptide (TPR) repeat protein